MSGSSVMVAPVLRSDFASLLWSTGDSAMTTKGTGSISKMKCVKNKEKI
jgi:hypothetical protein